MQFPEMDSADNGYFVRRGGRRRDRQRHTSKRGPQAVYTQVSNTNYSSPTTTTYTALGARSGSSQRTVDVNHAPELYLKRRVPRFADLEVGGPFYSIKVEVSPPWEGSFQWLNPLGPGYRATVQGAVCTSPAMRDLGNAAEAGSNITFAHASVLPDTELLGWGTTGIARTLPTAPEVSLAQTLGELREGIPQIIGQNFLRKKNLSSLGSEYLNYTFGIAPLVSDVASIIDATKRYEEILKQFRRDNGRLVRRKITLVDDQTSDVQNLGVVNSSVTGLGTQALKSERTYTTEVWFSGAYKLAYPLGLNKALDEITEFNRVYGVIPTPELAWNLLPWSWLSDWFFNTGDIMKNISTLGNQLQLKYGYVMGEVKYTRRETGTYVPALSKLWDYPVGGKPLKMDQTVSYHRKRRLRASPFGFSTQFGDLSGSQKAILTALGLSRLRM